MPSTHLCGLDNSYSEERTCKTAASCRGQSLVLTNRSIGLNIGCLKQRSIEVPDFKN